MFEKLKNFFRRKRRKATTDVETVQDFTLTFREVLAPPSVQFERIGPRQPQSERMSAAPQQRQERSSPVPQSPPHSYSNGIDAYLDAHYPANVWLYDNAAVAVQSPPMLLNDRMQRQGNLGAARQYAANHNTAVLTSQQNRRVDGPIATDEDVAYFRNSLLGGFTIPRSITIPNVRAPMPRLDPAILVAGDSVAASLAAGIAAHMSQVAVAVKKPAKQPEREFLRRGSNPVTTDSVRDELETYTAFRGTLSKAWKPYARLKQEAWEGLLGGEITTLDTEMYVYNPQTKTYELQQVKDAPPVHEQSVPAAHAVERSSTDDRAASGISAGAIPAPAVSGTPSQPTSDPENHQRRETTPDRVATEAVPNIATTGT